MYTGQQEQAFALLTQAQQVAQSIDDDRERAKALSAVAGALARAGRMQEAQQVAEDIAEDRQRAWALGAVAAALAEVEAYQQSLELTQRAWLMSSDRIDLSILAQMVEDLVIYYPLLGIAMGEGFTWVDDFLKQA
jgi:tetratricopeptide (TPR) repeat protein